MTRFRLYYNKDKACGWLNEMAAQGWRVVRFGGGLYKFVASERDEYTYRMDFAEHFGRVSAEYRALMEDMGLHVVGVWGPWVLLEALSADNVPPLYTDSESQEAHARRILVFFKAMALVMLILCMVTAAMCIDAEGDMDTATLVGGWITVVASAAFSVVLLRQCRRLRMEICRIRAERGEAQPEGRRRLPALMLIGILIMTGTLLASDLLEPWHGLRLALQITGLALWIVGLTECMVRRGA